MKIGRTTWFILGISLFVAGAVVLYVIYNGQMDKQQQAKETIAAAEAVIPALTSNKLDTEEELAQVEAELARLEADMGQRQTALAEIAIEFGVLEDELSGLEQDRAQAVLLAIAALDETAATFISSIEIIEYSESLFQFADESNLEVKIIEVAELRSEEEAGVTYSNTRFTLSVRGETEDILSFLNAIATDDVYKTAVFQPVEITLTEPLTDGEKLALEEEIRGKLIEQATEARLASLDTEDMVGFILEAIKEVTGQEIEAETVAHLALTILDRIAGWLGAFYQGPLAGDLAELIEEHIADTLVNKVTATLAEQIVALVFPQGDEGYDRDALVELLGEDLADILGEEIAGASQGDIASLLNGYIALLVEKKTLGSVADSINEGMVNLLVAQEVTALEMPQATMTLNIYGYESYSLENEGE